ncbi:MAG: response regulator [Candidatus Omnitrophota bacterium]|jgi:DNA-binding response OmpR family regulator
MEKTRVMLIDDEENFLKITKINLERTGKYSVDTASDANGLIDRIRSFKPDIIMLDLLMPKMSGVDACQALKKDPEGKKIPVIIISALDTDHDKLRMYEMGVVDFIAKPVDMDELISKIETALKIK